MHGVVGALTSQPSLFGDGEPAFDADFVGIRRIDLGRGAWVDVLPSWLEGHERVFRALHAGLHWSSQSRPMYDRIVKVPRLLGSDPNGGSGHPILASASIALSDRYGEMLDQFGFALYRDGNDSVAWHGDTIGRTRTRAVVATVSLGTPRRFALRPAPKLPADRETEVWPRPRAIRFDLGHGDLVVMGGTAQRTWQHAVPKVRSATSVSSTTESARS